MKEQWKEELKEELWMFDVSTMEQKRIEDFISSLLEEQKIEEHALGYLFGYEEGRAYKFYLNKKAYKQDLIEQILKDAPEDFTDEEKGDSEHASDLFYKTGFNTSNSQWRELLNKLK